MHLQSHFLFKKKHLAIHIVYSNPLEARGRSSIFGSDIQVWPLLRCTSLTLSKEKNVVTLQVIEVSYVNFY